MPFELAHQPHARGPEGTVPILRRDDDELFRNIRPGSLQDFLSKYGHADDQTDPEYEVPGASTHKYAFSIQTVDNLGGRNNFV